MVILFLSSDKLKYKMSLFRERIFLIGYMKHKMIGNKLPSVRDCLQVLFYHMRVPKFKRQCHSSYRRMCNVLENSEHYKSTPPNTTIPPYTVFSIYGNVSIYTQYKFYRYTVKNVGKSPMYVFTSL